MMNSEAPSPTEVQGRLIWPVGQWPSADRDLLCRCCDGSGPLGDDNRAVGWGERRQKIVRDSYGRYLAWLDHTGLLDPAESPSMRITPVRIKAFTHAMTTQGLASVSVAMVVGALAGIAQAMAPNADWSWLKRRYSRLKMRAKPSRNKRDRVVPSAELYALGINLMETACDGKRLAQPFLAASQYRDGLQISLLAARPLRIRNFQDIELGRTLIYRGETYWLMFDEEETKTGRPIEVYVPEHLTPYLEGYLKNHRQLLLAKRPAGSKPTRALWVSRSGEKMEEPAIRLNIERRTKVAFGHSINPHLFRDCLATSFAIEDPEHVRCVSPILGHGSLATAEKYYNQATSLTAAHAFSATMLQIRYAFIDILKDEATHAFLSKMSESVDSSTAAGETES